MSLVLNGTMVVAGLGACAATPRWPGKSNHSVHWDYDISLLPGGDPDCSASNITVAYHHGQVSSYKYSIPAWTTGTCEYEPGRIFTLGTILARDDSSYDACGTTKDGTDLNPCHGYIGQLSDFAADHESHRRFMCEHRSMGLWAASTCAGPVTLLVSVYERSDGQAQAFCERYEGKVNVMVGAIAGSLVGVVLLCVLLGFAHETDSGVGRCLRNFERLFCKVVTLGYCGGLSCCRAQCMPKDEEAVHKSWRGETGRDCADAYGAFLDRVCSCCDVKESAKVQEGAATQTQAA